MDGGSPRSFGVSDFTLAPNAFYTIDRAAGSEYFTVQAIENGTQITFQYAGAADGAITLNAGEKSHPSQKMLLPATQLGQSCYREMFYGCTSLSSAVVLPARNMVSGCYFATFYDCRALTSVTCMLETAPTQAEKVANLDKWFKNITVRGTFKCPASMVTFWNSQKTSSATSFGSIPSSWTVQAVAE